MIVNLHLQSPWPKSLWGLGLGVKVKKIRQGVSFAAIDQIQKLTQLGFEWEPQRDTRGWPEIRRSLEMYRDLYGNLSVPFNFVVPSQNPWPAEVWGVQLGSRVSDIRAGRIYLKYREELNAMKFVWDATDHSFEKFFRALTIYRQENGHVIVPRGYIVPDEKEQPRDLVGFPLGEKVLQYREIGEKIHPAQYVRLNGLGFAWGKRRSGSQNMNKGSPAEHENYLECMCDDKKDREYFAFQQIYDALFVYREKYGDVNIPSRFIVPGTSDWPSACHGLHLGRKASSIRRGTLAYAVEGDRRRMLEDLGLEFGAKYRDTRGFAHVYQALVLYKQLYGHLNIPRSWVVPMDDDSIWPEQLRGMRLGRTFYDIRRKAAYTKKSEQRLLLPLGVLDLKMSRPPEWDKALNVEDNASHDDVK